MSHTHQYWHVLRACGFSAIFPIFSPVKAATQLFHFRLIVRLTVKCSRLLFGLVMEGVRENGGLAQVYELQGKVGN